MGIKYVDLFTIEWFRTDTPDWESALWLALASSAPATCNSIRNLEATRCPEQARFYKL